MRVLAIALASLVVLIGCSSGGDASSKDDKAVQNVMSHGLSAPGQGAGQAKAGGGAPPPPASH